MSPHARTGAANRPSLASFAYYTRTNSVAVYGGNDGIRFEQERKAFAQGADIIVATPGRLISHLQLGNLDLSRTTHIILDEADRMLDMGFFDDIMTIIKQLPAAASNRALLSHNAPRNCQDGERSHARPG